MKEGIKDIKLFLTDVDGCLTDGSMYYSADGDVMKRFSVYDGAGIQMLQHAGIPCGILTGEVTEIVRKRAEKLNLKYLYMGVGTLRKGVKTKREVAEEICAELGITLADVAYVGDDVNDIDLLEKVGYPFCPANARDEVKAIAGIHVLKTKGGEGAIREVTDMIRDYYSVI